VEAAPVEASPEGDAAAVLAPAAAADAAAAAASTGAEGASPAAAAPATAAASAMIDVSDFTTWTSDTWALLDWDSVAFPSDPAVNIASVRYYLAVAMILWYPADLRGKHKRVCSGTSSTMHGWPRFHLTCTQSDWRSGPELDLSDLTRCNASC
jgi:hypothetical protein